MTTPAIKVEGLGKRYRLVHGQERTRYRTLRDTLVDAVKAPFRKRGTTEEFWALSDVSFEVQPGEVVGIIGRNGAGKSTLLKILSRITKPTKGRVEINGRVGSLLEVGTGFHPELTGRENIYLNGAILGMGRAEISKKFDEIVAFAEVEKFLDTPVKRYSSGMYVRLAFAVAAHLEPEILIVDEVLAVGDAAFQKKCFDRIKLVSNSGCTVLLVSHDPTAVRRLCRQVVWLEKGRVRQYGDTSELVTHYLESASRVLPPSRDIDLGSVSRRGTGQVRLLSARYFGAEDGQSVMTNGPMNVNLSIWSDSRRVVDTVVVIIYDINGVKLVNADTSIIGRSIPLVAGATEIDFHINSIHLSPGIYRLGLNVSQRPATLYDHIDSVGDIEIADEHGLVEYRPPEDGRVTCAFNINVHAAKESRIEH